MRRQPPVDDRVFVAYYDTRRQPHYFVFDFLGLPLGSAWRAARCAEYRRIREALVSQGCELHCWDPEYWPRYKNAFIADTLNRRTR